VFHEVWEIERFQTAKVTFKVIQGHCQWYHSIVHIQFPISVTLYLLSMSCTVNEILSLVSQNMRRSRDTSLIPFEGNVSCMRYYSYVSRSTRNLKCITFIDSKDMTGAELIKTGTWVWPRPLGSSLSLKPKHLTYSTCIQNLAAVASVILEIWLWLSKLKNGSCDPDHAPFRVIRPSYAGTWYSLLVYKIWSLYV